MLAVTGPVSAVDPVVIGALTKGEFALSSWSQMYKIKMTALDGLQSILVAVDEQGVRFDVSKLVSNEIQRRRVLDELLPPHQRKAKRPLFTDLIPAPPRTGTTAGV